MAAYVIYRDVNTLVGQTADSELVDNEKAIKNSLYNILTTPLGSRYRRPDYGSRLWQFIQEPSDDTTAFQLETYLVQSIERWEPRVQLIRDQTRVTPLPTGGFDIQITFTIPKLNTISGLGLVVSR